MTVGGRRDAGLGTALRRQRELWSLFRREGSDPDAFYGRLAQDMLRTLPSDPAGLRILDLGCGPGHYTNALAAAGAQAIGMDVSRASIGPSASASARIVADGMRIPVRSQTIDGVVCSNMLEHAHDARAVIAEIARIVRPGGWVWLSWTNWFSPWGGHETSPWHYAGGAIATRVYVRRKGRRPDNEPGVTLFPVHVGATLRHLRNHPSLELIDSWPRYYRSQRWVLHVPGLREVATWNCLVILRKRAG